MGLAGWLSVWSWGLGGWTLVHKQTHVARWVVTARVSLVSGTCAKTTEQVSRAGFAGFSS